MLRLRFCFPFAFFPYFIDAIKFVHNPSTGE